jgi:hypothetical protein
LPKTEIQCKKQGDFSKKRDMEKLRQVLNGHIGKINDKGFLENQTGVKICPGIIIAYFSG